MFGDQRKDQFTKDFPSRNSTFFSIGSKLHSLFEFRVRNRSANRSEKTRTRRCTRCVRVVSLGGHVWPACAFRKMRTVLSAPRASPFFFQMLVRNARESRCSRFAEHDFIAPTWKTKTASTDKRIPLTSSFVFLLLRTNWRILFYDNYWEHNNYEIILIRQKYDHLYVK